MPGYVRALWNVCLLGFFVDLSFSEETFPDVGDFVARPTQVELQQEDNSSTTRLFSVRLHHPASLLVQLVWYTDGLVGQSEFLPVNNESTNYTSLFSTNSSHVKLEIITNTNSQTIIFRSNVQCNATYDFPQFPLIWRPSRNLTFTYGSATPGKILLPVTNPPGFERELSWGFYTANYFQEPPTIREFSQQATRRSKYPPIRYINSRSTLNKTEELYILSSQNHYLEGLVEWTITLSNTASSSLVDFLLYKKILVAYEQVYTDAFPESLLDFVNKENTHLSDCVSGKPCEVICEVVGFNPENISLYRLANHSRDLTHFTAFHVKQIHRLRTHYRIPEMNASLEGQYLCEAVNSLGHKNTITFQLFARTPIKIHHNESSIVQLEDVNRYSFNITCVASGHPVPSLSFRKNRRRGKIITNSTEYSVVTNRPEDEVRKVVLTIHDLSYDIFAVVCVAENRFESEFLHFYP